MPNRIPLGDWQAVLDELHRFGTTGSVRTGDGWIRVDFGSAHVEASRDGRVSTGMPLHEFDHVGEVDLVVDHEAGSVTIEADDVTYTFRRPGG